MGRLQHLASAPAPELPNLSLLDIKMTPVPASHFQHLFGTLEFVVLSLQASQPYLPYGASKGSLSSLMATSQRVGLRLGTERASSRRCCLS